MLEPDEPAFDAVPADCRVTGYAMHALADAFLLHAQERGTPAADAAGAADEPEEGQRATAHRVARRRDVLAPIIEALRRDAADPDDRVSLWAGLLALADGRGRPPPLLGVADGAVQYRADNGEAAFLSRKSFMDRMRRAAKKAR